MPDFSLVSRLRFAAWVTGICGFVFGILERSAALLLDGSAIAGDLIQLFTAASFFLLFLVLKPQ